MNRMNYRTIFIFFIFSLLSCKNSSNTELQRNEETIKDLNSLGIIPKESFEYNSLVKAKDDTLEIVTCAKYVIRPFGGMNSEEELKRSLLSNFKIISQQKKDSLYFYYTIELNENRLNLFFENDDMDCDHSNIISGEINDTSVTTINNVKIGMSIESFLKFHFESYPKTIEDSFKTIIFDYCLEDIIHIYTFSDKKLERIKYRMND